MSFRKTHDIKEINSSMIGSQVILCGWVEDLRKLGKMTFLTLRDVTGRAQIIVKGEVNEKLGEINRQSVIRINGTIQETKAHDFKYEVGANNIEILSRAIHPLPIDPIGRLESNIDNRLNNRALDMRNQKTASIFKMRSRVLEALRKSLLEKNLLKSILQRSLVVQVKVEQTCFHYHILEKQPI